MCGIGIYIFPGRSSKPFCGRVRPSSAFFFAYRVSAAACISIELLTTSEYRAALRLMRRRSASGSDRVPNRTPLNLPDQALVKLLNWYNDVWKAAFVPREWK